MSKNITQLKELKKQAHLSRATEKDENGKELIRMQVLEDGDFLSPYSREGEPTISSGVADFLDNTIKSKTLKQEIHIEIAGDVIDEKEKEIYRTAVGNYYRSRIIDIDRRLKRNTAAALVMAITAVVILTFYLVLELRNAGYVFLEIVNITAWVFMWEAVDLFFFERKTLKIEQLRDYRLYSAEITYKPLSA